MNRIYYNYNYLQLRQTKVIERSYLKCRASLAWLLDKHFRVSLLHFVTFPNSEVIFMTIKYYYPILVV